uniref:Uncharacterized protein n=1 Tax=Parascaris univalens TaxID=6257 RepID=A0A915CCY7_PARUN
MEVLQPLNGKRLASYRDSFEEDVVLAKRSREEHHTSNVTPLQKQYLKQRDASNETVSSANTLTAEEMNAWIVHGGYSPRVVQSFCRPGVGIIYRGDCY